MAFGAAAAAQLLLEARRARRPLLELPQACRPQTAAEAYAVQDLVLEWLGPVGAWKVGAASASAEPACAPLPASFVVPSGHAFPSGSFRLNGLEAEIAFKLAQDLPPRSTPYYPDDVAAAIASVHPAIEVVDSRFTDMRGVDAFSALADLASHGALVVGSGRESDIVVDQTRQRVILEVNGKSVANNIGGNSAGDVFRLLAWLANHAAARCGGLRAGQVVTTGSCTALNLAVTPAQVRATLSGIGACETRLH